MSDPSEVNQPHPVLFVQGHGRYIQVPYYVPVHTPQIYPNFPVDPNHPHWFTGPPYGNCYFILIFTFFFCCNEIASACTSFFV